MIHGKMVNGKCVMNSYWLPFHWFWCKSSGIHFKESLQFQCLPYTYCILDICTHETSLTGDLKLSMRAHSSSTVTLRVEVFKSEKQTFIMWCENTTAFFSCCRVRKRFRPLDVTVRAQRTREMLTLKAFCLVAFCKKAHRAFFLPTSP